MWWWFALRYRSSRFSGRFEPLNLPIIEPWQHPAPLIAIGQAGDPISDHAIGLYRAALEMDLAPA